MEKQKYQYEVTVNNIEDMEPMDVFNYMHTKFDNVYVPETLTTAEDLQKVSVLMAWCINVKSYLNTLSVFLDIMTRNAKNAKEKEKHDQLVCKKNIIKSYLDHINDVYTGTSRVSTIYFKQQEELMMEGRANNIQYGGFTRRQ